MAQGKMKIKAKLPQTKKANQPKKKKGLVNQRRGNAPIQPKKAKLQEALHMKKMITKTVNSAMEDELRQKALGGKQSLTKKIEKITPAVPRN